MWNWLKSKLEGGRSELLPEENRAGADAETIELLIKDFEPLEERVTGITRRLLDWVLNGEDEPVLATLTGMKDAGRDIGLGCCELSLQQKRTKGRLSYQEIRSPLLARLGGCAPELLLRIGRAYEAAARNSNPQLHLQARLGAASWLEILLLEACSFPKPSVINAAQVEEALACAGLPRDLILRQVYFRANTQVGYFTTNRALQLFANFGDFPQYAAQHHETIREALVGPGAEQRVYAMELLEKKSIPLEPLMDTIAELAVAPAKTVRAAAAVLLRRRPEAAAAELRRIAGDKNPAEARCHAIALLAALAPEASREFLLDLKSKEKAARVLKALEALPLLNPAEAAPPEDASWSLPPLPPVELEAPLPERVYEALWRAFETYHRKAFEDDGKAYAHGRRTLEYARFTPSQARELFMAMQSSVFGRDFDALMKSFYNPAVNVYIMNETARDFLAEADLELIHVVRLLFLLGIARYDLKKQEVTCPFFYEILDAHLARRGERLELRRIAHVFRALGGDPAALGREIAKAWYRVSGMDPQSLWTYFAEYPALLEEMLGERPFQLPSYERSHRRHLALRVLAAFPAPPPEFLPALWEAALNGHVAERPLARQALEKTAGAPERILATLQSNRKEERAAAAEWIGRLRPAGALPALERALKKEKNEAVIEALCMAMESYGADLERLVDREGLLAEARAGLAKGKTDGKLEWLPLAALPRPRWSDRGEPVPEEIIAWLVIKQIKLGDPEPGPILRRICARFTPAERAALALAILGAWIAHDTVPRHTPEEIERLADQQARQLSTAHPQHYTYKQVYQSTKAGLSREFKGSSTPFKGALAVAGACGDSTLVAPVAHYLKEFYGYRPSQCRALLRMLSRVEAPAATQYLLSVATRFRTPGIRKEAEAIVAEIAARNGWTVEEFADRTIPNGGLDEEGRLTLDYGARRFVATLGADLKFVLQTAEGAAISALPEPRKDDDPELAAAAKAAFAKGKKEVAATVKAQTQRLYEAMCTQRAWPAADWRDGLQTHPILRHLCPRLVWAIREGDAIRGTFRPLEDGSLTDCADGAVALAPEQRVQLAHGALLPAETCAAWRAHLVDYEAAPLFEQFPERFPVLDEAARRSNTLKDFEGWMTEAFKLRGLATKLGYIRGEAMDAGFFYTYLKNFPGLGIQAEIEFTGNSLPEENRPVALVALSFKRSGPAGAGVGRGGGAIALGELPAVLVAECWNDLRRIAESGDGFDPEWQTKAR